MPLGNQYGINLGEILSTASAIKSARLTNQMKQAQLDASRSGAKGGYHGSAAAYDKEEERKKMESFNRLILKKTNPELTDNEVDVLSKVKPTQVLSGIKALEKLDEGDETRALEGIEQYGRHLYAISTFPPEQQEAAYQQFRDKTLNSVSAEQRAKLEQGMPKKWNRYWAISEMAMSSKALELHDKNRQARTKHQNALELERTKEGAKKRTGLQTEKNKLLLEKDKMLQKRKFGDTSAADNKILRAVGAMFGGIVEDKQGNFSFSFQPKNKAKVLAVAKLASKYRRDGENINAAVEHAMRHYGYFVKGYKAGDEFRDKKGRKWTLDNTLKPVLQEEEQEKKQENDRQAILQHIKSLSRTERNLVLKKEK